MVARRHAGLALGLAGLPWLVTGCAAWSTTPPGVGEQRLSGRLAARVDASAGQGPQAGSAAFELTGSPRSGAFTLSSPLGTVLARVRWHADQARVEANGEVNTYPSLDAATEELARVAGLAIKLPVAALFAWLQGQPLTDAPFVRDSGGFRQFGWTVNTSQAADGRLSADWPGPPAASLRVVLDR